MNGTIDERVIKISGSYSSLTKILNVMEDVQSGEIIGVHGAVTNLLDPPRGEENYLIIGRYSGDMSVTWDMWVEHFQDGKHCRGSPCIEAIDIALDKESILAYGYHQPTWTNLFKSEVDIGDCPFLHPIPQGTSGSPMYEVIIGYDWRNQGTYFCRALMVGIEGIREFLLSNKLGRNRCINEDRLSENWRENCWKRSIQRFVRKLEKQYSKREKD